MAANDPIEPETRYAKSGGLHIAYQVVGDGPLDLVVVPGFASNLELTWEAPSESAWLRRLATFSRLIILDKRGTGLSDRVSNDALPTLEQRMDDLRAVLDAVGSERAALLGFWEGGPMCMLFAATYPERTRALALYGTPVAFRQSDDYPWGFSDEANENFLHALEQHWGQGILFQQLAPREAATDPRAIKRFARYERLSASPGAAIALWRMNLEVDVRHILPAVHVPSLVLCRREDPVIAPDACRYLADRLKDGRFVQFEGDSHLPWTGDWEPIAAEIQSFLTGARPDPVSDRVLATLLFIDIVGSTAHAAEVGDARWRELRSDFYRATRRSLDHYRGIEVDATGDGLLARFDGPARGIRCAEEVRRVSADLGLQIRAGLHTGECEIHGNELAGIAVHIGARVAALAEPGKVLVSSTVKDLVAGAEIRFADCGEHALKGVPEAWRIFEAVQSGAEPQGTPR